MANTEYKKAVAEFTDAVTRFGNAGAAYDKAEEELQTAQLEVTAKLEAVRDLVVDDAAYRAVLDDLVKRSKAALEDDAA